MITFLMIVTSFIILILLWTFFGGEKEPFEQKPPESPPVEPEAMFRQRATDREIEEKFPEEALKHRRKSDRQAMPSLSEPDESFQLPYLADDIISDSSRLRVFKRTLINSEIYAGKGDFTTAISLYDGVKSRTRETDVREKIDANIEYLKNYRQNREKTDRRQQKEKFLQEQGKLQELKLTLDTSQLAAEIRKQPSAEEIAENVSKQLKKEFEDIQNREMGELKKRIEDFQRESNKRIEELNREREKKKKDEEMEELNRLRKHLNLLSDRLEETIEKIPEASQKPTIIEARYDQPIPLQLDPQPILDLLERIPRREEIREEPVAEKPAPFAEEPEIPEEPVMEEPAPVEGEPEITAEAAPEEEPSAQEEPEITEEPLREEEQPLPEEPEISVEPQREEPAPVEEEPEEAEEPEPTIEDIIENIEEQRSASGDEEDEFELMRDIMQPRDPDTLSDEEIFEKLLKEDGSRSIGDDIEIIGEKKQENDFDIMNRDQARERREEESFYKNLLATEKRYKKELPILKVSYDFKRLPDAASLSREKNLVEYSFYKYKPMLEKAHEFIQKRQVRDAINYYKVVMSQNIPPEFKSMIRKNINDLTEYLEKYLTGD